MMGAHARGGRFATRDALSENSFLCILIRFFRRNQGGSKGQKNGVDRLGELVPLSITVKRVERGWRANALE